ncbi:MAG: hypothetical protein H0X16_12335 [Chloroflexi bacterium]|nr:hypothetical protein [Chloroflexota bacterium]
MFLYIDPGSGSLIIQALIAAIVSVPFLLRNQIRRGVGAMRRVTGRDEESPRTQ